MRREKYITLLLQLFILNYINSQTLQVIPSSPQSQIFEQYINHEITEYNGLPKIEIPLYEIKTKGITIPLTLSYHASGVKYMQYDGDIGAGWSIGALGYRVTRQVKGASDFDTLIQKIETRQDYNECGLPYSNDKRKTDGFLLGLTIDRANPQNNAIAGVQDGIRNEVIYRDGEYDRFTYNFPTSNGSFILTDRTEGNVAIMDEKQDKIHVEKDECHITDVSGIEYFFGGIADDGTELIEREVITKHETAWVLKEIKTPMNETIRFKYKKYKTETNRYSDGKYYSLTITEAPYYFYSPTGTIWDQNYNFHLNTNGLTFNHSSSHPPFGYGDLLFLDEIETDNILVQFEREKYFNESYEAWSIPYMLKKIVITDKLTDIIIKEIILNSQMLPAQISSSLQYKSTPSHLTLNSVLISDKKYEMEYYSPPLLNFQYAYPDQWNNYSFNFEYAINGKKLFLHNEFLEEEFYQFSTSNMNVAGNPIYTIAKLKNITHDDYFADRSVDELNVNSFSLKKIKYPTGGYTEYIYEPHGVNNKKGGGLRIREIISKSVHNEPALISRFEYQNGISSFDLNQTCFETTSFSMSHHHLYEEILDGSHGGDWYTPIYRSRTYSMNPVEDFSLSEYKIQYRNVDILEYDESLDKNNGKKSFTFNIPNLPIVNQYEGVYLAHAFISGSSSNNGIFRTYDGQKPTVKSISHFDDADNLIKKEVFEYKRTESNIYEGLKAQKKVSSSGGEMPIYPNQPYGSTIYDSHQSDYFHVSSYVDWMNYEIETGTDILSFKTDTLFTSSGNIVTIESYDYNDKYQVEKVSLANNADDVINIKEFKYPQDFALGNNVYQQMVDKNMISPIIEKSSRIKDDQRVKKNRTEYIKNSNIFLPGFVKVSLGDNEWTELEYDRYDDKGNILQYTTLDGISTTILWSYKHQYPVAEIKNATYNQIVNNINPSLLLNIISSPNYPTDAMINALSASLKSKFPQAEVTTYTYMPLVGMTSKTDPRGVTTYYEYDDFGRLKATYIGEKDANGNETRRLVTGTYRYHYKE